MKIDLLNEFYTARKVAEVLCHAAACIKTRGNSLLRALLLLVFLSGVTVTSIQGQQELAPLPQHPLYPLAPYNEDWSFLSTDTAKADFWDPIKFIPLSKSDDYFLSIGGEIRETYERFHNTDFGLQPQDPDGYSLQRYRLHADLHASRRFRFFTELNSSLEFGRTGGPRPVLDKDVLDVHQGFFDVLLTSGNDRSLTVRVGRQEMDFGSGRLVALREGPNVPLSFDGVRILLHTARWQVNAFATRPVQNKEGIFDDPPQPSVAFWGVYAAHGLRIGKKQHTVGVYYLGLDRKAGMYNQGTARELRHTIGGRIWDEPGDWVYDAEAMYQFGDFGSGSIRAWRVAGHVARTLSGHLWHPQPGLDVDIASGDKNPQNPNLETFNALFQSGLYSGRAQILGPNNAIRLEPEVGLRFSPKVTLSVGWGFFWRESSNDGLYGIPGNLIVPSNGVKSRYTGSRPITELGWQITRHLSAHVNYIYVFSGRFEEEAVHSTSSMSYVAPWVTYRF